MIVSVAALIAVAANADGRREIIGLGVGPSQTKTFWMDFLRSLRALGLDGVKLVISDLRHPSLSGFDFWSLTRPASCLNSRKPRQL